MEKISNFIEQIKTMDITEGVVVGLLTAFIAWLIVSIGQKIFKNISLFLSYNKSGFDISGYWIAVFEPYLPEPDVDKKINYEIIGISTYKKLVKVKYQSFRINNDVEMVPRLGHSFSGVYNGGTLLCPYMEVGHDVLGGYFLRLTKKESNKVGLSGYYIERSPDIDGITDFFPGSIAFAKLPKLELRKILKFFFNQPIFKDMDELKEDVKREEVQKAIILSKRILKEIDICGNKQMGKKEGF